MYIEYHNRCTFFLSNNRIRLKKNTPPKAGKTFKAYFKNKYKPLFKVNSFCRTILLSAKRRAISAFIISFSNYFFAISIPSGTEISVFICPPDKVCFTRIIPYEVGISPSTQLSPHMCGSTLICLYPGAVCVTPRT